MSVNYIQSVPKLKGRENYDVWCFAAENLLVLEGMIHCIRPDSAKEIKPDDDAKTKAKLIMTIDPGLYVHIRETKSSQELWNKLKNMFDDSGFSRKITLLRHLISIRQENCETMTAYVTQVVETAQRLKGTGFAITDEWVGSLLLAGLPEKFSPMIMAVEHSGIQITTDAIKSKLIDMEVSWNSESETSGAAFAIKKRYSPSNKNGGKFDTSRVTGGKQIKNITCFKCREVGHFRNQCPMLLKTKETNAFSVVFLNGKYSKTEWYVDSGASMHMTPNKEWINNANYKPSLSDITVANDAKVQVLCSGDVQITTDRNYDITVKDVQCVPSLTTNLLSVSELIKNGNSVVFEASCCYIRNKNNELVATAESTNGVYKLKTDLSVSACGMLAAPAVANSELWHRRLAHINSRDLDKMRNGVVHGVSYPDSSNMMKDKCVTCCEGKQMRLPFQHVGERSTEPLQIVHADVCGPMEKKSIGGSQYFLLFVDDFSRMNFIYFLKQKNEVYKKFKEFKAIVENQQNRKIKILRTDNGGEFCNGEMDNYLKKEGIIHQKTTAYTPEQNGVCERANRTVVEKGRCLLFDAKLEKKFWAEAANTAVYLKNRSATANLKEKTPYEAWCGKKPDLSHIRLFGSNVMVHIPKEKRLKWDKKAEKYILVGFSETIKGYRVYDPRKNTITVKRDIIVMEGTNMEYIENDSDAVWIMPEEDMTEQEEENLAQSSKDTEMDEAESQKELPREQKMDIDSVGEMIQESMTSSSSSEYGDSVSQPEPTPLLEKRNRKAPERYGYVCFRHKHKSRSRAAYLLSSSKWTRSYTMEAGHARGDAVVRGQQGMGASRYSK